MSSTPENSTSPLLRTVLPLGLLAALLVAATTLPASATQPADDHALTLTAAPVQAGETGTLSLNIAPKAPWKWNAEYPAKLDIEPSEGLTFEKTQLTRKAGDFEDQGKAVTARATFSAKAPGAHRATVKGRFGLCDANVCIIKRVDAVVPVEVR